MLQQFYKETLQSQYIKYILNNVAIPTVPFTSNIVHVTKGNSYIHDGYFVTAKESKEIAVIEDRISKNPLDYDKYFIKHEPYIFGEFYNGLTTTYKSNTLGYDSETHYYLGEYLRAYRAYYDIDLMPFYNCFSNEYINYVYLNKGELTNQITLEENYNQNYTIISVPIKFCQTYTIAIQCPHEVRMLPVFVGKKGILEERTKDLHMLNYWGKSFSHIDFKNPVYFESPHITGVNDDKQLSLQSYDKYLRLLIQVPSYIESSIVVLEGKYQNCGPYQEKIFNLSQEDVQTLQGSYYITNITPPLLAAVSENSSLICKDITKQKIYLNLDNKIFTNKDNTKYIQLSLGNYFNIRNIPTLDITNKNNFLIKAKYDYDRYLAYHNDYGWCTVYELSTDWLCQDYNKKGENYNVVQKWSPQDSNIIIEGISNKDGQGIGLITKEEPLRIFVKNQENLKWADFNNNQGNVVLFEAWNSDNKPLRALVAVSDGTDFQLYAYEYAFYIGDETANITDIGINIYNGESTTTIVKNILDDDKSIQIDGLKNLGFDYLKISDKIYLDDPDNWYLKTTFDNPDKKAFVKYLNQNMISNLSLLQYNNSISYAFCGRLIEYLVNAVISSNEKISKNTKRVQSSISSDKANGLYDNALRIKTFKSIQEKKSVFPILDFNGFVDKDSERILTIQNEVK